MPRSAGKADAPSPQAKLASVIKSARDLMRKDAGLNGDLDRIPQLAWLLFLKAFDGLEENREVTESNYRLSIEWPYRWRDWAAPANGRTGDALIKFVNEDLFAYLRGLVGSGGHDQRDVLAAVFKETNNRMLSGYLLRDVVNKVNVINFASADDIHTMAHLYESMLREMRDAAGDSGEFYTPRPVIRFIVEQVDPQPGEIVLDPACGTGGFLVEALDHIRPQMKTTQQRRALERNLRGIEKKPLPYLLGMMNLLLHEVEQPNLTRTNALARPITQISRSEKVNVILTNPPFGGEEEKSILANFPEKTRTAETAWLFLQLVVRQLADGGRCGIVVPNGVLYADGVGIRVKEDLLGMCNLHTVVRLPDGAFAPYTDIPSNLLFFEKTGRTKEVWFYEILPPVDRKKYSKAKPLRFEEFAGCTHWWGGSARSGRSESDRAWRVSIADIEANGFNLDFRNPNRTDDPAHRPPQELIAELITTEYEIIRLLKEIGDEIGGSASASRSELERYEYKAGWAKTVLDDVMQWREDSVSVDETAVYPNFGILSFGRGTFEKVPIDGSSTSAKRLNRVHAGQFIYSRLFAFEGAYSFVPASFDGWFVSAEFPTFDVDPDKLDARWLAAYLRSPERWAELAMQSKGLGLRRQRVPREAVLAYEIWLPPYDEQQRFLALAERVKSVQAGHRQLMQLAESLPQTILNQALASM
jgi:type I restriction enzyme M protein